MNKDPLGDLKPLLVKKIDSLPAKNASCTLDGCPTWWRSHFSLGTNLGMIGNVSSSTGILILQGENDTSTPVQQALPLNATIIICPFTSVGKWNIRCLIFIFRPPKTKASYYPPLR